MPPDSNRGDSQGVSFTQLLRANRNFRRIWIGEAASWLGDWFSAIALYTLVQKLTGSPFALGLVFLTKMLPFAVASPLAGLLVDRFDRRRLMIAADLLRALLVLGFLLVEDASDLYLIYALTTLQVALTAVFIPARSASIPNVTTRRELLTANALGAATWSTLLAVGAALGGFATAWLGIRAVFVLDSLTYVISAAFLMRTAIPQPPVGVYRLDQITSSGKAARVQIATALPSASMPTATSVANPSPTGIGIASMGSAAPHPEPATYRLPHTSRFEPSVSCWTQIAMALPAGSV